MKNFIAIALVLLVFTLSAQKNKTSKLPKNELGLEDIDYKKQVPKYFKRFPANGKKGVKKRLVKTWERLNKGSYSEADLWHWVKGFIPKRISSAAYAKERLIFYNTMLQIIAENPKDKEAPIWLSLALRYRLKSRHNASWKRGKGCTYIEKLSETYAPLLKHFPDSPSAYLARYSLALELSAQGNHAEAITLLEAIKKNLSKILPKKEQSPDFLANFYYSLARECYLNGNPLKGAKALSRALTFARKHKGPIRPIIGYELSTLKTKGDAFRWQLVTNARIPGTTLRDDLKILSKDLREDLKRLKDDPPRPSPKKAAGGGNINDGKGEASPEMKLFLDLAKSFSGKAELSNELFFQICLLSIHPKQDKTFKRSLRNGIKNMITRTKMPESLFKLYAMNGDFEKAEPFFQKFFRKGSRKDFSEKLKSLNNATVFYGLFGNEEKQKKFFLDNANLLFRKVTRSKKNESIPRKFFSALAPSFISLKCNDELKKLCLAIQKNPSAKTKAISSFWLGMIEDLSGNHKKAKKLFDESNALGGKACFKLSDLSICGSKDFNGTIKDYAGYFKILSPPLKKAEVNLSNVKPEHCFAVTTLLTCKNKAFSDKCLQTLLDCGENAIPLVIKILSTPGAGRATGKNLTRYLMKMKTSAAESAPFLIPLLNPFTNNYGTPENAAMALGYLGPKASMAIPALILNAHSKMHISRNAKWALGKVGKAPKAAVPQLAALLDHPDKAVKSAAAKALLAGAGLNENEIKKKYGEELVAAEKKWWEKEGKAINWGTN